MPEGFNDPAVPATRGRRDPDVAARIAANRDTEPTQPFEAGSEQWADAGEGQAQGPDGILLPGDRIFAKRGSQVQVDGFEHWFTLGAETTVQPDEEPLDAFSRVAQFVNLGVQDLVADAEEGIRADNQRRRDEERHRPITPRSNTR
jgi:hypothetical protein